MSTPKATKAELAAALNDAEAKINGLQETTRQACAALERAQHKLKSAEAERTELQEFLEKAQSEKAELQNALTSIFKIHSPFADTTGITLFGMGETSEPGKIALRCMVCRTPEHHTWGNDNAELWPCATLRTYLQVAPKPIDVPANPPENEKPSSDGVQARGKTSTQQSLEDRFVTCDRDKHGQEVTFDLVEGEDGGVYWGYGHRSKGLFVAQVRRWQRHCGYAEEDLVGLTEVRRVEHLWARYDDQDEFHLYTYEPTGTEADADAFPVTRLWL